MARQNSRQQSLFGVRQFVPQPFEPGSLYDVLEQFGDLIMSRSDFEEADPSLGGNEGWCPVLLSKLELLRGKNGWSDRQSVDMASNHLKVKACLGLGVERRGPSQPTLSRHRARMQKLGLDKVYHQRLSEVLQVVGLLRADEPVLIDSVPIDGAGQQLDTYNLLAGAIRQGVMRLSEARAQPVCEVAKTLGMSRYLARSAKGAFEVDWDDEASRREFLSQLVSDAGRINAALDAQLQASAQQACADGTAATPAAGNGCHEPGDQPPLVAREPAAAAPRACDAAQDGESAEGAHAAASSPDAACADEDACPGTDASHDESQPTEPAEPITAKMKAAMETLEDIIAHDIEFDGNSQVKGIRQQAAGHRRISLTDPDMRHGRKSASRLIAGYKAQIVSSLQHGFILATKVFAANGHDGDHLPELVQELEQRGHQPPWWAGDHAHGTLRNHRYVAMRRAQGDDIELIARMSRPTNGGRYTKDEFDYDFDTHELVCPQGQRIEAARWERQGGRKGRLFVFPPQSCHGCPSRTRCVSPTSKSQVRSVFVVEEEERLIREHLRRREEAPFREKLRKRPHVERVIAGFAQCGGKQATRFGLDNVAFDANISALAYNLRLLGSLLRDNPELRAQLCALVHFFCRALLALVLTWRCPRSVQRHLSVSPA
jgi:hypothetical protein